MFQSVWHGWGSHLAFCNFIFFHNILRPPDVVGWIDTHEIMILLCFIFPRTPDVHKHYVLSQYDRCSQILKINKYGNEKNFAILCGMCMFPCCFYYTKATSRCDGKLREGNVVLGSNEIVFQENFNYTFRQ